MPLLKSWKRAAPLSWPNSKAEARPNKSYTEGARERVEMGRGQEEEEPRTADSEEIRDGDKLSHLL